MSFKQYLQQKVENRQELNELPQDEAQARVTNVLYADQWIPNTNKEIDWDGPFGLDEDEEES